MADKSAVPIVRVRDTHHAMESQLDPSCFSQNDSGEVKATFAPDSVVCVRVDSQTLGVCKIMSTVKLSMLSSMSDSCGYEESSDKDCGIRLGGCGCRGRRHGGRGHRCDGTGGEGCGYYAVAASVHQCDVRAQSKVPTKFDARVVESTS